MKISPEYTTKHEEHGKIHTIFSNYFVLLNTLLQENNT